LGIKNSNFRFQFRLWLSKAIIIGTPSYIYMQDARDPQTFYVVVSCLSINIKEGNEQQQE